MGAVDTAQADFEGYVKANPGASFDKLQVRRDKMMADIAIAANKPTTGLAKNWSENWLAANKNLIYEKSQSAMEAIQAGHQFDQFNLHRTNYVANGNEDKLVNLYKGMVGSELLTKDTAALMLSEDLAKAKEMRQGAILEEIHETAKDMPYTEAIQFLNDMKGIKRADRNDLITRRKRQNEIETSTTNREVRWDTLRKVTKDPESVTDDYLEGLVKPNSLTWDDAEEFKKIRDDATNPLQSPRAQLYFDMLDTLYAEKETDTDEAYEWDIANEKLMQFFKNNPNATAKQANEVYQEITGEKKENWVWKLLSTAPKAAAYALPQWIFPPYTGQKKPLVIAEEPKTLDEFQSAVGLIKDKGEAKEYYDKWKHKWQ